MGYRPRLGGQGTLQLPEWVTVTRADTPVNQPADVIGEFSARTYDPFERRPDGLLLAESFARLELDRPRQARAWMLANGVVDVDKFYPDEREHWGFSGAFDFQDPMKVIEREQHLVRFMLRLLDRLTAILPPPVGQGVAWRDEWHPTPLAKIWGYGKKAPHPRDAYDLALLELRGHIERALAPTVIVRGARPTQGPAAFPDNVPFAVVPIVSQRWTSIMAPISLQLYEGLRRISEVRRAATWCRECGWPFLILDGRRVAFCTDRERARYNQRQYRARHNLGEYRPRRSASRPDSSVAAGR